MLYLYPKKQHGLLFLHLEIYIWYYKYLQVGTLNNGQEWNQTKKKLKRHGHEEILTYFYVLVFLIPFKLYLRVKSACSWLPLMYCFSYELLWRRLVLVTKRSKNWFLLLKVLTIEHTLTKRISCEIYTIGRGATNISINKWKFPKN